MFSVYVTFARTCVCVVVICCCSRRCCCTRSCIRGSPVVGGSPLKAGFSLSASTAHAVIHITVRAEIVAYRKRELHRRHREITLYRRSGATHCSRAASRDRCRRSLCGHAGNTARRPLIRSLRNNVSKFDLRPPFDANNQRGLFRRHVAQAALRDGAERARRLCSDERPSTTSSTRRARSSA